MSLDTLGAASYCPLLPAGDVPASGRPAADAFQRLAKRHAPELDLPMYRSGAVTPSDQKLPDRLAAALLDPSRRIAIESFPRPADAVDLPGLYAWFVDAAGAAQLEEGLSSSVVGGLIYAGQAGAGTSSATLRGRVGRNHARGSIRRSTFRWTLAAVLGSTLDWIDRSHKLRADGEQRLSRWIADHLKVAVAPIADRLTLLKLEDDVLTILDPPLNLRGMPATPLRATLSSLRASLPRDAIDARRERRVRSPRVVASERCSRSASGLVGPAGRAPDIHRFLVALEGKTIATMTGRPNTILKVSGDVVWVATGRSPAGKPVPISDVQVAANDLYRNGEVSVSVETVGHRSAFVGAVLSALPGTRADTNPRRIVSSEVGRE